MGLTREFFFSRTRRRAAHQYIKKKKGVETQGDTVMGLYNALTTDAYRLLQIDLRVGPDQNQKNKKNI